MPAQTLLLIVVTLWIASEVFLGVVRRSRTGESSRHDRSSLALLWVAIFGAVFLGIWLERFQAARIPGGRTTFLIGIAAIIAGIVIRWVAIATLWRYFTVDVAIRHDHKIISHGLYRVVRHPSYSGCVLSFIGLGVVFANWISLTVITIVVLVAFSYRIAIEERALIDAFGDEYRDYSARTKRLIPGIY